MDEDMERKIKEVTEKLQEMFGDEAKVVGPFSGKSMGAVIDKAQKYMTKPIVTLKANRMGTHLEVNQCSTDEAYNAAVHIITHCLHMFPKDMRNDMLFSAIQDIEDEYDEGMLFMEEDDEENREE